MLKRFFQLKCLILFGALAALPAWLYAGELPLPKDVKKLSAPYQAMIGRRPVQIQAFRTHLSVDELRAFYEKAFPDAGWKIEPLPWQQYLDKNLNKVETLRNNPPAGLRLEDPEIEKKLSPERTKQIKQHLINQIVHAAHGDEHVAMTLWPQQDGTTGVFVNRWVGSLVNVSAGDDVSAQSPAGKSKGWLGNNLCCTNDTVPASERKLPLSVPDYPRAKMISAGSPMGQGRVSSAIYVSGDSGEAILSFYRSNMAYNGWQLIDESSKDLSSFTAMGAEQNAAFADLVNRNPVSSKQMSFKREGGLCGVSVVEPLVDQSAAADQEGSQQNQKKTVVIVTYMDVPTRKLNAVFPQNR